MLHDDPLQGLSDDEVETWTMLRTASLHFRPVMNTHLKREHDINHHDFYTLLQVARTPEHRLPLGQLAVQTGSTLSHLSRIVTRLEVKGLLERIPDRSDGRVTLAHLTPAGVDLVQAARPAHEQQVRELFFDHLTEDEHRQFSAALKKITAQLTTP